MAYRLVRYLVHQGSAKVPQNQVTEAGALNAAPRKPENSGNALRHPIGQGGAKVAQGGARWRRKWAVAPPKGGTPLGGSSPVGSGASPKARFQGAAATNTGRDDA